MKLSKKVVRMGIDLGKNTFHVFGVEESGSEVLKKKRRRKPWVEYFANRPPGLVGMETCGVSHYWAWELVKLGHEVRLISSQFVKPYIQGNKNAYNEVEGICEAVGRPNRRFVTVKNIEQPDLLGLHRIRQSVVKPRTALANKNARVIWVRLSSVECYRGAF
jgi:transposase